VTTDAAAWVIAVMQVLTAVGIVAFWTWWLRAEHETSWWPIGYDEHERAFVLPDCVLAGLLTASALLSVIGSALGGQLALVAAGMMLFLGLIDGYYFARNNMYARERGGLGNALIVTWMIAFALVLILVNL
jgi:hypothetical protein